MSKYILTNNFIAQELTRINQAKDQELKDLEIKKASIEQDIKTNKILIERSQKK